MNLARKFVSIAAAAALVAGAGALASAPAQASKKAQPKGATIVNIPLTIITTAADDSVVIDVIDPATLMATMDTASAKFPVSGPLMDGVLHHKGGLSLTSKKTGVSLKLTDPTIEYATGEFDGKGTLVAEINGIPEAAGPTLFGLNGTRLPIFNITNMEIKNKIGKPTKKGGKWSRTDSQTITGDAALFANPLLDVAAAINRLLGTTVFKQGMAFGDTETAWSITRSCKTKKACTI